MPNQKKTSDDHKKAHPSPCGASMIVQFTAILLLLAIGFAFGQVTPPFKNLWSDSVVADTAMSPSAQQHSAQKTAQPATQVADQSTGPAWLVRCGEKAEGQMRRPCEMVQAITMRETGQRVVEMALTAGYKMQDDGEVLDMIGGVVVVPLGVAVEEGVIIRVDDAEQARKFPIQGCAAQGCQARIAFTLDEAQTMAKGETLSVIARNTEGRPVIIPMRLAGFDAAMDEMQERAFAAQ